MRTRLLALLLGPGIAIIVHKVLPASYVAQTGDVVELLPAARGTLAMAAWMAAWWLLEAVPVAATALLPVALFPLLGLMPLAAVCEPYAHPLIFLFFGGFLLSIAIEKWQLHAWVASRVVHVARGDARRLVGGFMLVAALASMWLSNTATTIMMLPIAASVIARVDAHLAGQAADDFARCLLLGVAYAASIGGTATLIGSPPNLFAASFLEQEFGLAIDFRRWLVAALPVALVMLPLTWLALTRLIAPVAAGAALPGDGAAVRRFSSLSPAAHRVALVFVLTALGWLLRGELNDWTIAGRQPLAALTDTGIAVTAGLALFVVGAGSGRERLLAWEDTARVPFGTLILFGGGLALAASIRATGADAFIGAQLAGLVGVPPWLLVGIVVAAVVFLTELTSNTATTTTLVPILAAAALALGLDAPALVVVTALAASSAFMMPVATPPNAIVFASGRISVAAMARAGLLVNLLAIVVIGALALAWVPRVAGGLVP